ncbi:MAG: hypothetical protein WBD87_08300 [Candidatus Acidiferrales bacterium]
MSIKDGAARIDLTEGEVTRVSVGTGLRNRLAHFKEEFTEVAGPYSLDEEFFNKLPEAELIKSLKPPALDASITDILQIKAWLDQVKQTIDDLQNLGTKMLRQSSSRTRPHLFLNLSRPEVLDTCQAQACLPE